MSSTRRMRRPITAVLTLTALLVVTGCGASGTSGGADRGQRPPAPRHSGAAQRGADGETSTENDAQSTFALDVDTASYGYARRLINDGRLPEPGDGPAGGVRQLVPPGLSASPTGDGFAVHVDGARLPGSHRPEPAGDVRLLRVGLQTRVGGRRRRRPDAALTFVVDVSGSMGEPGRLDLVQDALHTLVDQLRPTDSVALVAFSRRGPGGARDDPGLRRASELHAAVDDAAHRGQHQPGGRPGARLPGGPRRLPARRHQPGHPALRRAGEHRQHHGRPDPAPGAGGGGQADHPARRRRRQRVRRRADGTARRPGRRVRGVRQPARPGPGGVRPAVAGHA